MDGKQKTLRVIECGGTLYEIGRQYGEAAGDHIRKSLHLFFTGMENGPYFQAGKAAVLKAARNLLPNVHAFDPSLLEPVRGMAEGAGVSFDEAFALRCYLELVIYYPVLGGLCTSFAVTGKATRGGITLLGQNVDWHPDTPLDLLRIRRPDGLKQLVLCFLGSGYYFLNSGGFGNCANLTLSPMATASGHVPLTFYLEAAMGRQTLAQAMEALRAAARGIGYYHLADAQGEMSGIESTTDGFTILGPLDDVLAHANNYEAAEYRPVDMAPTFIPDSFARAARMRELIMANYGEITPEKMMEILADHQGYPNSICRHLDESRPEFPSMSLASFIMVPETGRVFVANGPACENGYVEYSLD